ncbi:L-asparaginase 1 [Candidatus Erwinia haradaeae]|uniref:L-asparaginase 1 n=1 Tax=Candidatus Erwinia haradaeae TaxID=1922217 RepID=A0A451CZC2_9GAMM|nr:asparaginase [Candidatus Erwinia haradaeae]VFP78362.1 L-asparaginase 1 [Candidatus Erwinia haradaeae]
MQKKSIYVAYTGGTIGMQYSHNGCIPVSGYLKNQLDNMLDSYKVTMPNFTMNEYHPLIDSADIKPKNWQMIANDIYHNYHLYDGFVIVHGTDTMAFTASALSFMLENLTKPVIITGAQIPLEQFRSDGKNNLINALFIAAKYPIHEVTLLFNNTLYRGNRATKVHADRFNAFASPNFPPLLEVGPRIRVFNTQSLPLSEGELVVHPIFSQSIGIITIYPGISAQVVRSFTREPMKALIIRSYGMGNAPQNKEFLDELKGATQRGVVVVNVTQCISGKVNMKGYMSGHRLACAGVVGGADLSVEAALAKLYYLLSKNLTSEEIRDLMQKNLRGELTVETSEGSEFF